MSRCRPGAVPAGHVLAAAALVGLLLVAGCSGSPSSDPSGAASTGSSGAASSCPGGEIRLLQGQPADLPGGGSAGIGQVSSSRPPTVRLAIGGTDVDAASDLSVGDRFSVAGSTYQITCISRSKVTAKQVSS
ncbi:hypothetical protein D9V37_06810 [Nocardioides mangrovicus]|uniref:Lipoprotein n=1 Tax=Nocardioides mangrovicus TaxID=2478913 RepID=A0A3L8P3F4_9ACTN|nr:DUF6406 domain-containing protein [Nocardioides mangrovicus]RLV49624.1 hypothetical protein D9V37_06810 [Nocardioides mangrovicus]